MKNQIWAKKSVEQYEDDIRHSGLKRSLGKWELTALGIGAIIGAGIFVMTGIGAKEHAGPALVLSFIVAGLGCGFAALCYAEFASFLPVEGSAYAYSYAAVGELFAWIIGWDLILEYAMASSAVAVGWSGYVVKFLNLFDIKTPLWLVTDYWSGKALVDKHELVGDLSPLTNAYSNYTFPTVFGVPFAFNLPAFLIILVVTYVLVKGIKEASSANNIMVFIKLGVVLFIIIVGFMYVDAQNWDPFIPERIWIKTSSGQDQEAYGWVGIFSGAAYIFFAYIGFDAVSTQAGEAINPQKDVPTGVITSLIICTLLYILVALVVTGMVNYKDLDIAAPIAGAFGDKGLSYAVFIISIAAIAGLTSVLIVMLLGQSRVLYAIAKDGLLPSGFFAAVHPTFKTPYKTTILIGFIVAVVAAFTPIDSIAKMVNIGTLLAFVMVCSAVWLMRFKEPSRPRPFRVPFISFIAPMGILFNLLMMVYLGWENWVRLLGWLAIGFVIYFLYGKKHSKLRARGDQ